MRIFIIGPGWVGKSTSGKILADLVNYNFIDLDEEFYNNIGNIWDFIKKFWYESYCFKNSKLFYNILNNSSKDCVISLSSWFLVHENLNELTENHKKTLNEQWVTLTLLPSKSIEESINIAVKRQLLRWFGLN